MGQWPEKNYQLGKSTGGGTETRNFHIQIPRPCPFDYRRSQLKAVKWGWWLAVGECKLNWKQHEGNGLSTTGQAIDIDE